MSVDTKIATALLTRFSVLTTTPELPMSEPNIEFDPPSDNKWLRASFIPNSNRRLFLGADDPHQYRGIFQVDVHWPKNRGELEPRGIADQVAAHFPCGLSMVQDGVKVRVTKQPDISSLIIADADTMIAITVEYEVFA